MMNYYLSLEYQLNEVVRLRQTGYIYKLLFTIVVYNEKTTLEMCPLWDEINVNNSKYIW